MEPQRAGAERATQRARFAAQRRQGDGRRSDERNEQPLVEAAEPSQRLGELSDQLPAHWRCSQIKTFNDHFVEGASRRP